MMDSASVEQVVLFALGGADQVTVDDLAGTDTVDSAGLVPGTVEFTVR